MKKEKSNCACMRVEGNPPNQRLLHSPENYVDILPEVQRSNWF